MPDRLPRGLLDTSVVIDLDRLTAEVLPEVMAISSITLAELAAGPHAASTGRERAIRQHQLQRTEAAFDALAFDDAAARSYGVVYAAVVGAGRKARGARAVDLMIAAVAAANRLPLYTRNPDDFRGLDGIVDVVAV